MSEWDRQTSPGGAEGPQWVSAAEAADVAGVTPGTVRYWARNGLIVSEVVQGAAGEKTLVRLDEVLQHARQETGSRGPGPSSSPGPAGEVVTDLPARTSELAPILKSIPEIMAQLTAATDRAARAETKVEFLSAQLADLRQRLAEAESVTGAQGDPVTLPEAWETPEEPPATIVAEEVPEPVAETTGVAGWPAPPAEALRDVPVREPVEPGPDTIDWGTPAGAGPVDGVAAPQEPAPALSDPSLRDIWDEPATSEPAPPPPAAGGSEVEWHDPAGASTEDEPTRARPANAPVPDGDEFYGPRRRRWFRRRR